MLRRPTTVKHVRLTAANVLLLALVAACGADVDSSSNGNSPVVAHLAKGDGSVSDALIGGALTMSGGCLLVGGVPVVWPYGTTWDAETEAVRLSEDQIVALGDRVSGGGGYPYLSDLGAEFAEPLEDCPTNEWEEVAMFNAQEQITITK